MTTSAPLVHIYGLFCPVTSDIRYVGKAIDPQKRFASHIATASPTAPNRKARWIHELLVAKKQPGLVILDRVAVSDWREQERLWITIFGQRGKLLNDSRGGEGPTGRSVTRVASSISALEEQIRKQAEEIELLQDLGRRSIRQRDVLERVVMHLSNQITESGGRTWSAFMSTFEDLQVARP